MAKDRFESLDLNLLKVFMVLMQQKNMRKASTLLHVSQPAISQSLQKLRFHFDDPLFVKVSQGLKPTAFALELSHSITPHYDALKSAVNSRQEFDPRKIEHTLRIALVATVQTVLAGPLYRILREQAPNATLELLPWNLATFDEIRYDRILMGVSIEKEAHKEVYAHSLLPLEGQLIVRQDHPIKKTRIKPSELEGAEIAAFVTPGWNDNFSYAQQVMRRYGVHCDVAFKSEVLDTVLDVVSQSDLIMPHSNLFPIERFPHLRAIDVDIPLEKKQLTIQSYYHTKDRNSDVIQWLNNIVFELLNQQANKHS